MCFGSEMVGKHWRGWSFETSNLTINTALWREQERVFSTGSCLDWVSKCSGKHQLCHIEAWLYTTNGLNNFSSVYLFFFNAMQRDLSGRHTFKPSFGCLSCTANSRSILRIDLMSSCLLWQILKWIWKPCGLPPDIQIGWAHRVYTERLVEWV